MNKEHERDIIRSEGEGMIRQENNFPPGVTQDVYGFVIQVLDKFHEGTHVIDLEHAAAGVLGQIEEGKRVEIGTEDLRSIIRDVVGQEEWEKLEREELYRALDHDAYKAGVSG
ncbi:MAG TPA: hypothetical protein VJ227_02105 [Patescibacteria group bacterium]|nr:hypothetical protein [Patescibacteria group bacterium]